MSFEKEKKYIIHLENSNKNKFLVKNSEDLEKIGIIQWYLLDDVRVRLQIKYNKGKFTERWIEGKKLLTENVMVRKESENNFIPENENFLMNLSNYPFVLKIRHYLKKIENVKECILDEFLFEKHPNKKEIPFLLETELLNEKIEDKVFNDQIKILDFMNVDYEDVTHIKEYTNRYLATVNKELNHRYLRNYLKEKLSP